MKRALLAVLLAGLASAPVLAAPPPGEYRVVVEAGVRVKMRDGIDLVADVYRPLAEGRFPVLLQRTPYNRAEPATGVSLASHGYVVVLQDTRGRYASEGDFYPFRDEGRDGYDTVEWAAALPYADGKVGMFGGSYVGATQMLAAAERPPHLLAIFPVRHRLRVLRGLDLPIGRAHAMVRLDLGLDPGRRHGAPGRREPVAAGGSGSSRCPSSPSASSIPRPPRIWPATTGIGFSTSGTTTTGGRCA